MITDPNKVIPSWTQEVERDLLAKLASQVQPKGLIVEIGALYGGTTVVLAKAAPKARVITIDEFSWTPEGYPKATKELLESHLMEVGVKNVVVHEGKSEDFGKVWDKHIDLLFVDGGHSINFVLADLRNFGVRSEVIALHDYDNPSWSSIHEAVDIFLKEYPYLEVSEIAGTVCVLRHK